MQLWVNGEPRAAEPGVSIAAFLERLGLDPRKVAVERNAEIAPRSQFAAIALAEGDRLEIVQIVGGG